MNNELLSTLEYMERERGISRETLIEAVEYALESAAKKSLGTSDEVRVHMDPETSDIKVFAVAEVTPKAKAGIDTVSLAKARQYKSDAKVGDMVEVEVTPRNFGRIAAQTAKQAIIQKIRQAERDRIYEEYKNRIGDIVSGGVKQFNRSDIIVDIGRAEAYLPASERVPTEEYQIGDRIRAMIVRVENEPGASAITLSRSAPEFVEKLFRLEVSEIAEGVVEIKGIAREPGYRTKIAVVSHDPKVDPVGACVGMRGIRVKNIVHELSGEKIDIVRWSDDIKTYVANALSPAKLSKVVVDPDAPSTVHVIADQEQLSLAIGKRGQNVRLTARLLGWRIDVQKEEGEESFEEKLAKAVEDLAAIEGIGQENAKLLVNAGFLTAEGILAVEATDIEEMAGIDNETAVAIIESAAKAVGVEEEQASPNESS